VETAVIRDSLQVAGCNHIQGYFYSTPIHPDAIAGSMLTIEKGMPLLPPSSKYVYLAG